MNWQIVAPLCNLSRRALLARLASQRGNPIGFRNFRGIAGCIAGPKEIDESRGWSACKPKYLTCHVFADVSVIQFPWKYRANYGLRFVTDALRWSAIVLLRKPRSFRNSIFHSQLFYIRNLSIFLGNALTVMRLATNTCTVLHLTLKLSNFHGHAKSTSFRTTKSRKVWNSRSQSLPANGTNTTPVSINDTTSYFIVSTLNQRKYRLDVRFSPSIARSVG